MTHIKRESLMTLEAYAVARGEFREKVMAHKRNRNVALGDHVTLLFEDELTVRYQIQEMLRIEKTFEEKGIHDEIEVYDPLVPDGSNFKATMMIEYPDAVERRQMLEKLKGVESAVWLRVAGYPKIHAIGDEDLERENDQKTSSVHFLRFELTAEMKAALKHGAALGAGVSHPAYTATVDPLPATVRAALVADLA